MKNQEKLATKCTQDEEKQSTNTNNVNKTTWGKGLTPPLFFEVSVASQEREQSGMFVIDFASF